MRTGLRRTLRVSLGLWLALLVLAVPVLAKGPALPPALVQAGVIDALLAGGYQGSMTLGELRRLGDLGLGTLDALDGELVLLDGQAYQIPADGRVRRVPDWQTTPFAQAVRFRPTGMVALPKGAGLRDVEALLDAALADTNRFAAVRLDARFASVKARSVPRQTPPYRPLAEVAKEQSVFDFFNAEGTLVGLRGPDFVRGLGVPGWHWHFLTRDRARGGHVLECVLAAEATAKYQTLRRLELILPQGGLQGLDLARDRAQELRAVESGR